MALINSFGSLKTALARYMFHQRFAPDYDLAVANFEAAANRRLRVRPQETSTNLTTIAGVATLPVDYLLWRTVLWLNRNPIVELDYVHPAYLTSTAPPTAITDAPTIFTIEGNAFQARPIDDGIDVYEFHYYQKIPTITGNDNAANWLINDHPDVYEFGALAELFALGRNADAAQLYKARRDEVLTEIIRLYSLTTGASSPAVRGQGAEYF
jgi:hypothetical protein